jgi:hypothetical protein
MPKVPLAMNIALTSVAFLVAILCAGAMGFAIQRGATCTVAAVDEAVNQRRFQRLLSMMEASLWVVGGLAIVRLGSDEWSYAAMPFDFYLGCATLPYLCVAPPPQSLGHCSPVLLIPGGNDGLALVDMPLLWPYAWLAFLTMCGAIAAAQWMEKSLSTESMREVRSPGH